MCCSPGAQASCSQTTFPAAQAARARLASEKGQDALQPWNTGYALAGDVEQKLDPYFPFEVSSALWGTFVDSESLRPLSLRVQCRAPAAVLAWPDSCAMWTPSWCTSLLHWA